MFKADGSICLRVDDGYVTLESFTFFDLEGWGDEKVEEILGELNVEA